MRQEEDINGLEMSGTSNGDETSRRGVRPYGIKGDVERQ